MATTYLSKLTSSLTGLSVQNGRLTKKTSVQIVGGEGDDLGVADIVIPIKGPGDDLGFVSEDVLRRVPDMTANGSQRAEVFEANYFPYIEFKSANTPWSRSLDLATDQEGSLPFMALIVLSEQEKESVTLTQSSTGQQLLDLPVKYIPSQKILTQSAHIQVEGLENNNPLRNEILEHLEKPSTKVKSRVMCLRKLEPSTNYTVYLISLYQASVDAVSTPNELSDGLIANLRSQADDLLTTCRVLLAPWSFSTGEGGDFESIARELKAHPVEKVLDAATAVVILGPGDKIEATEEKAEYYGYNFFRRQAALMPLGTRSDDLIGEGHEKVLAAYKAVIETRYEEENGLEAHVQSYVEEESGKDTPLLGLPLYGRSFVLNPVTALANGTNSKEWLKELNFNPVYRIAAGLGVKIVKDKQEDWVLKCWRQAGEIKLVNQYLRQNQSGLNLSEILWANEIENNPIEMLPYLAAAKFLPTLSDEELDAIRQDRNSAPYRGLVSRNNVTCTKVPESKDQERNEGKIAFAEASKEYEVVIRAPEPTGEDKPRPPFTFPNGFLPKETTYIPSEEEEEVSKPLCIEGSKEILDKISLNEDRTRILNAFINLPGGMSISENFDPVLIKPVVTDPVYVCLKELSLSHIFPGYNSLPKNSITLLQENTAYIESIMVGANHELNNELAFREYPFMRSTTTLTQFWESVVYEGKRRPDVKDIHSWANELGKNRPSPSDGGEGSTSNRLIFVIKSDLLRRYPGTVICLARIAPPDMNLLQDTIEKEAFFTELHELNEDLLKLPVFTAKLTKDCYLFGFDLTLEEAKQENSDESIYHFCIQQRVETPKYGLDLPPEGSAGGTTSSESDNWSWPSDLDHGYLKGIGPAGENYSSAEVGKRTYQKPIRLVMPITLFLPQDQF